MPADERKNLRTTLEEHKRVGKELITPFMGMGFPIEQVFWWRDFLPEFLWIDSLVNTFGEPFAVGVFGEFLSAADAFNPHPQNILDGTISAFNLIPADQRPLFLETLSSQVEYAVQGPFNDILTLYPECPMSWMAADGDYPKEDALDSVREAVFRLTRGKDEYGGLCRALPLHRMFKHNRIYISDQLTELIEAIGQYPKGDRWRVESFARQSHEGLMMHLRKENSTWTEWTQAFWRSNLQLTPCIYGHE